MLSIGFKGSNTTLTLNNIALNRKLFMPEQPPIFYQNRVMKRI